MKKFWKKIILFLLPAILFCFLADRFLTHTLQKSNFKLYVVWNDMIKGKLNADVLIIGSSRARAHVDSKIMEDSLGLNTYNLGLDGYTFGMQYCRYQLALAKNKKPALIIQSLDYSTFTKNEELYQLEQFNPYFQEPIIMNTIKHYKGFSWWDEHLPLVRYIGNDEQIFNAVNIALRPKHNKGNRYKGFYSTDIPWTNEFEEARKKNPHLLQPIDSSYRKLFEQYLKEVKQQGIQMVFVFSPVYIEGQEYISNSKEIIRIFENYSKDYQIPFLNYSNDTMCLNKTYYYNTTHLNKKGSALFSNKLGHDLKMMGIHGLSNSLHP